MKAETAPETLKLQEPHIEVIYAGGTISSFLSHDGAREGGHVVDLLGKLSAVIPEFSRGISIGEAKVAYIGLSENMDMKYLSDIEYYATNALRNSPDAIVITHGTDSMEHTAKYLQHTLGERLAKRGSSIILTGANEDFSDAHTDAWENMSFAFRAAAKKQEPGVYVAFHGKLIPAEKVVKEPYNGKGMNYISIDDPEYAQKQQARQEKVSQIIEELRKKYTGPGSFEHVVLYPVNNVRADHKEFEEYLTAHPEVTSVVFRLYHSGTANTENPACSVSGLIARLRKEKGIISFGVTENGEPVDLHLYETSVKLRNAGLVPLYDMDESVALEKLSLMGKKGSPNECITEMLTNKAGEIDEARIIHSDIDMLQKKYARSMSHSPEISK